ncbi:MAG: LamG domain-containing protein [Spirochaetes bacterium]|nr:LamG domain-containing protein [Spirochaetota bacterium]
MTMLSRVVLIAAIMISPLTVSAVDEFSVKNQIEGLAAYYTLAGDYYDDSGNNNHGDIRSGTAASYAVDHLGNADGAYYFDGSGNSLSFGSGISLRIARTISISFWVKPQSLTDGNIMGRFLNTTHSSGWGFWYQEKKFYFSVGSEVAEQICVSDAGYDIDAYYHVVGVYDKQKGYLALYINGKPVFEKQNYKDGTIESKGGTLTFGTFPTQTAAYFKGCLEDVRIYNAVLKPETIEALFKATK